jgi:sarcosine oxidase
VSDREVGAIAARIRGCVPAVPGAFLSVVTCMYTNTVDEHFVIGTHPVHERVTVACGFSGHGFKFVPVVGEILADLTRCGWAYGQPSELIVF